MCRNIKVLYNFEPPATHHEIHEAALQYVRKISGFRQPSQVNRHVFDEAVEEVAASSARLLASLETSAPRRDRQVEAGKAHERAVQRFAGQ